MGLTAEQCKALGVGCTNHGCVFVGPEGIKTNGICSCIYRLLRSKPSTEAGRILTLAIGFVKDNATAAERERLMEVVCWYCGHLPAEHPHNRDADCCNFQPEIFERYREIGLTRAEYLRLHPEGAGR